MSTMTPDGYFIGILANDARAEQHVMGSLLAHVEGCRNEVRGLLYRTFSSYKKVERAGVSWALGERDDVILALQKLLSLSARPFLEKEKALVLEKGTIANTRLQVLAGERSGIVAKAVVEDPLVDISHDVELPVIADAANSRSIKAMESIFGSSRKKHQCRLSNVLCMAICKNVLMLATAFAGDLAQAVPAPGGGARTLPANHQAKGDRSQSGSRACLAQIRLTVEERDELKHAAASQGLSLASFCRSTALAAARSTRVQKRNE